MNSNYGKSSNKSTSLNNFEFDLGLGTNRSRSLSDQKNKTSSSSSFSSTQSKPNTTSSAPSWQPNRPAWVHQPLPSQSSQSGPLSGPTSMVGDIFGKSWGSPAPSSTSSGNIGIVNKNPNLFGDLVSSAIGGNKGAGNVPLKNATPVSAPASNNSPYSMGNLADSLPKTGNPVKTSSNWGSSESVGSYTSGYNNSSNNNVNSAKLGGPSIRNLGGSGAGGINLNKDPFGSFVDFQSKPASSMKTGAKGNNKSSSGDDPFGDFQNAKKTSSTPAFPSNASAHNSSSMGSNYASYSKMDDFGIPTSQKQPPVQSSGVDAFDVLFSSSSSSAAVAPSGSEGLGSQQFAGAEDWGFHSQFEGGEDTSGTTEIEGLPPPPAGVSASTAKTKGMDNYKQGQYADAIKWLSWAVILLGKAGDDAGTVEVLSCRASCYKEVGEYKKAVADCTKVLEDDSSNVAVLVQRALLYESMEKYKLGAEDLRTVMKIDPGNRVARSTVHRLTKMAG